MLSKFAGLTLLVPEGWGDITADLPPGSPPTLARGSGVGALQFSVARYRGGADPQIDTERLREFFSSFCKAHSLGEIEPSVVAKARSRGVGGVSSTLQEVVAVWYLSNGNDVALVTYTSLAPGNPRTAEELSEVQAVVESIEFD